MEDLQETPGAAAHDETGYPTPNGSGAEVTEPCPSEGSSRQGVRCEVNLGVQGASEDQQRCTCNRAGARTGHQARSSHGAPGTRGTGCMSGGPVGGC